MNVYMKVSSEEDGQLGVSSTPFSHLLGQEFRSPIREITGQSQDNQEQAPCKEETANNNLYNDCECIKVIIEPCQDSDEDLDQPTSASKIPRIIPEIQLTPASYDSGNCHSLTIPPRDPGRFLRPEGEALRAPFNFNSSLCNADGSFSPGENTQDVQKTGSYLKDQIISFFQVSDNKLALKLFGNRNALLKEKMRQKAVGNWIIHPCSSFRWEFEF